jgi:6-phosphogluconate dehydrogenase
MELGMVGLGRMGANVTARLLRAGHRVVAFDRTPEKVQTLVAEGAVGATSLADLVEEFPDRVLSAMRFEFGGHEEKHS